MHQDLLTHKTGCKPASPHSSHSHKYRRRFPVARSFHASDVDPVSQDLPNFYCPVHSYPAKQFGKGEMPLFGPKFPDPFIGLFPMLLDNTNNSADDGPKFFTVFKRSLKLQKLLVDHLHQNSVDIILLLNISSISYSHRF